MLPPKPKLWFHAASVGEINMLVPLIRACQSQSPILVTTFTPTGLMQAQHQLGESVSLAYAPLDQKHRVIRWLENIQPNVLILAETELWPELCIQCQQRGISIVVVNARLSSKHFDRYQRWHTLYRPAIKALSLVACQSQANADRWQALGCPPEKLRVTGNLKAALASQRARPPKKANELIWVAGSVHPPEFRAVIEAHQHLLKSHPNAKLIIAPRHLRTLAELYRQLSESGLAYTALSPNQDPIASLNQVSIGLLETMGSLEWAYQQADWAFVGGTLTDIGGHNLYEPAHSGLPILTGPYVYQQQASFDELKDTGALIEVKSPAALSEMVTTLADDPGRRSHMGERATQVGAQNARSLEETMKVLAPWLGTSSSDNHRPESVGPN